LTVHAPALSLTRRLQIRQSLIWVKQHFVLGRQDYHWRHESILYGWKDGARHFFADDLTQDTILFDEARNPSSLSKEELLNVVKEYRRRERSTVWHEDKPMANVLHPTMKPVPLVAKAIRNSSRRGEIVFDGFAGAGSTLVAAQQYQRRAYVMELDPRYAAVDLERLADMGLRPTLVQHA
jgi:DNA modification methylase